MRCRLECVYLNALSLCPPLVVRVQAFLVLSGMCITTQQPYISCDPIVRSVGGANDGLGDDSHSGSGARITGGGARGRGHVDTATSSGRAQPRKSVRR